MMESIYWSILVDSVPIMIGVTFQTLIMTVNIHYATDNSMMAGIGLANVLVHCMGGSLIYGFNSGFTNYASRAFGAKNQTKFNQYVVQGLTNLVVMLGILCLLGFSSYRLAKVTGQEQSIAYYSYYSLISFLPGLCCFYVSDFVRNYLNSQLVFKPILYCYAVSLAFHLLLSVTLSSTYGFTGIIISTNVTFISLLVMTLIVQNKFGVWKFSMEIFGIENPYQQYKQFATECFYVAMPFCLDLFMYEFMTLYLGSFKFVDQTAAHVAVSNVCNLMIAPYLGYSICCMTKIGNLIGKNKPDEIDQLIKASCKLSLASIFVLQALLLYFEQQVANFYSQDEGVQRFIFIIFKLWIVLYLADPIQFLASHAFKALGMGSWVVKIVFICYYIIGGISMVVMCQLIEQKITAIWIGFLIGLTSAAFLFIYKYKTIDIASITSELYQQVKGQNEFEMLIPKG